MLTTDNIQDLEDLEESVQGCIDNLFDLARPLKSIYVLNNLNALLVDIGSELSELKEVEALQIEEEEKHIEIEKSMFKNSVL